MRQQVCSECFRSIRCLRSPWKCLPRKSWIATGGCWVLQKQKPCDNLQRDQKCFVMVLSLGSLFLFCLLCLNAVAILNHKRFLAPCKRPARTLFEACAYICLIDPFLLSTISQMDLLPGNLPSNCALIVKAYVLAAVATRCVPSFLPSRRFDYMNHEPVEPSGWKKNVLQCSCSHWLSANAFLV